MMFEFAFRQLAEQQCKILHQRALSYSPARHHIRPGVANQMSRKPFALPETQRAKSERKNCILTASALKRAMNAITVGKDVVIVSGFSDEVVAKTKDKGLSLCFSSQQTADSIASALGMLCREIALNVKLGGLVLTGGDTAVSCCGFLNADGITVLQEVAPGIPLGVLKGGPCNGLRVVTKAGAFGAEDALCKAVDC